MLFWTEFKEESSGMLSGTTSVCVNHPGVEAKFKCRQCGTPVCAKCGIAVPGGHAFCSKECLAKGHQFAQNAQAMDLPERKPKSAFVKLLKKLVFLVILLLIIGFIASTWEIPVLTNIVYRIRDLVGI